MKIKLYTICTITLFVLLLPVILISQPTIEWQKSFGGSGDDNCSSVWQTKDGEYIIGGWTNSIDGDVTGNHGQFDYWIVKLNSTGTIQWQKSIGGTYGEYAFSLEQTSDDEYIISGNTRSDDGDISGNHSGNTMTDAFIVKLDQSGSMQWKKCFGGSKLDNGNSIRQTKDGGFVMAGSTTSTDDDITSNHGAEDYWIVKLSSAGNIEWQKCYGGTGSEAAYSIEQTDDGGYIVCGNSNSSDGDVTANHGGNDYWVVKLKSDGSIDWQKSYGGSANDNARSISITSGGYVIAGYSSSNDGDVSGNHGKIDYWVIKINSTGQLQWQKTLGGSGNDIASSLQETADKGFVISGQSMSSDGNITGHQGSADTTDCWIVKLNQSGDMQWQKSIGGTSYDMGNSIRQTMDGGFIAAMQSSSVNGDVTGNKGKMDYWVVKLSPVSDVKEEANMQTVSITPGIAESEITVNLTSSSGSNQIISIYNLNGELQKSIYNSEKNLNISIADLPAGVYFVKVQDGSNISMGEFIKK